MYQHSNRLCATNKKGLRSLALVLCMAASLASCDAIDAFVTALEKIKGVLNDGVITLGNSSSSWQGVLKDISDKVTAEPGKLIRNEVNNLMAKGIAATGAEFRCNSDFVGKRMQSGLTRILHQVMWMIEAELAKQQGKDPPPKPVEEPEGPWLCTIVPSVLDRRAADEGRVVALEGFGMDLAVNKDTISVFLIEDGKERDVTRLLSWPSSGYSVALPLGAKGLPLTDRSEKISFRWNGKELASVSIFQPTLEMKICQQKEILYTPFDIGYIPPFVAGGDKDFDGPDGGPMVDAKLTESHTNSTVSAEIYMRAWEPKPDYTEAKGTQSFIIYTVPDKWKILKQLGPVEASIEYFDADHSDDVFTGYGPVVRWEFRGDRKGEDAGIFTGVSVRLAALQLVLEATEDCVPKSTLLELLAQKQLSTYWQERLAATQAK